MANRQGKPSIERTVQDMVGWSFDNEYKVITVGQVGFDGQNISRQTADALALKVSSSGGYTYVAEAAPGTTAGTAKWRIQRVDSSGNVTWKDGNANFDNTATDITTGDFS